MEVEVIKAKNKFDDSAKQRYKDRLRVAAYCRVSTDDKEQEKSYNSMIKHYTALIQENKLWTFAGIYADPAVTGTKVDKRDEFHRMIQDCKAGKIDMIIVKNIPRFARNTLDTLKYVRMLKEINVAVYFEKENIHTIRDGEFLIAVLGSIAQQEVENTSANVKMGLKMKMKRGEMVGFNNCLGYDYDKELKTISINPEGAKVVRYIFERYIAGAGSTMIARELNEKEIHTIRGNKWTASSIMGVINNEKYKGDLLLGKTFTVDPISKRRLENFGEEDKYYVRNHHEPIISEDMFEKAQAMRSRRNGGKLSVVPGKRDKYSRKYAFSSLLECGFCGGHLTRRQWHSNSIYKKSIWQCIAASKNGKYNCPDSKGIPEQVNNEKYKGDLLLGKTFTVDPISKRRLENFGEEDKYYVRNHHEPIISEDMFEKAQAMRSRRNGGKLSVVPGKRDKYSRKYAFSSLLECGFCGGHLTRRQWHSNSIYKKSIWQCIAASKNGKYNCPDSKGIPEQVIEEAFLESYRLLCRDNKEVVDEFIKRAEQTLGKQNLEKEIKKCKKKINEIKKQRQKLLDNYMNNIIAQDMYEENETTLVREISDVNIQLAQLLEKQKDQKSLEERISDFKEALLNDEIITEFDRVVFESIIEKVIVGGFDENGNKDPYKLTFIYKTGFTNEVKDAKKRFAKKDSIIDKTKKMCSYIADEMQGLCSYVSNGAAGMRRRDNELWLYARHEAC